jgi:hypothetical protein
MYVGLGNIRDRDVRLLVGCDQAGQDVKVGLGAVIPILTQQIVEYLEGLIQVSLVSQVDDLNIIP